MRGAAAGRRAAYEVGLAQLHAGASIQDALAAGDAPHMRAAVTDALVDLGSAREASRISLILADMAEGSAITSVARTWGVTHQLVSRYAHEAAQMAGCGLQCAGPGPPRACGHRGSVARETSTCPEWPVRGLFAYPMDDNSG